jgi:hypothetical protein
MADIDVVKKGSRAWLWVLIVLAALVLLWFLMANDGGTTVQQTGQRIMEGGQPQLAAVLVPLA